jgi:uncharacterized protein
LSIVGAARGAPDVCAGASEMVTEFTPVASLVGGLLIGLAAALLMATQGRVAGVSGALGGLLTHKVGEQGWRAAFVGGLLAGGLLCALWMPGQFVQATTSPTALIAAGLLVGVGTRLGNGCTSGHGVCGLARGSGRSLAAVLMFMATGAATVFITRHIIGG